MIETKTAVAAGRPKLRVRSSEIWELAGFSLVVLLPAVLSNFGVRGPALEHQELYSSVGFLRDLAGSLQFGLVAAFFMSRKGARRFWGDIASREVSVPAQILAGVGLWFAYYVFFDFWGMAAGMLHIRLPSIDWLHPVTGSETALNAVFSVVNGISEEVMRVYLLEQTQRAGLGRWGASLAAAAAMSSYHLYQGAFTLIAFMIVHVILNRLYLAKKPLVTLFVWHALSDFMHSTDLVGWQLVSACFSGGLGMGLYALAHAIGKLL